MISLNNVTVFFGGQILFEDASFMVNKGDRIGLVGKNGSGKSTLLKLIYGDLSPEEGTINTSKNLQTGYLRQDIDFNDGLTVMQEAELAFVEIKRIEKQLKTLRNELNERSDTESGSYLDLISRISELEDRYIQLDGYSVHSEISKVLLGLGFTQDDFEKQTGTFSGGWRMRIELAKILLQKPDALLLDEPTNHLDIESIIWLEQWVKSYYGAVILVSHDRTFLDAVTNRTIEIAFGDINDYKAHYSKFVELRRERQLNQEQSKKNQDRYIKHTKELIAKFRYKKSKAAFAQALIKKLEKLELIEVETDDVSRMKFRFPPAPHSGKVSVKMKHISKNYGPLQVLNNVELEVEREEKVAFVGKNGEGKTTLAKIIAGQLDFEGHLDFGHLVKVGYYAQNQSELLDDNLTVLETIENSANEDTRPRIRNILGSFLFSGDSVDKKIKVLSGGERARVALCKLLLEPVNFLIMDEPTNHLDMSSKDILKQALVKYNGTLIIVSHDRDFLQGLTEKVYEFKNRNIKEYAGDVVAFLETRNVGDLKQLESAPKNRLKTQSSKAGKQEYLIKKQIQNNIRKTKSKAEKSEQEIEKLEIELKELDNALVDPERFKELSAQKGFFDDYKKKKDRLETLMREWEEAQMALEQLNN